MCWNHLRLCFVYASAVPYNWFTVERVNNSKCFCILTVFMYAGVITSATLLPLTIKVVLQLILANVLAEKDKLVNCLHRLGEYIYYQHYK